MTQEDWPTGFTNNYQHKKTNFLANFVYQNMKVMWPMTMRFCMCYQSNGWDNIWENIFYDMMLAFWDVNEKYFTKTAGKFVMSLWNRPLWPISLTIFHSHFKWVEFFSLYNLIHIIHISTNFCSCHDSLAVVACAKLCSDHFFRIWMRAKWNLHHIWNMIEKLLVKQGSQKSLGVDQGLGGGHCFLSLT